VSRLLNLLQVSIHIFTLLAHVGLVLFSYATFTPQKIFAGFKQLLVVTLCITFISIAIMLSDTNTTVCAIGFFVAMIVSWITLVLVIFVRMRMGELAAKLWLLAYAPLGVILLLVSLDNFGHTQQALVGFYWPLYGLVFEIPILLLALMLRAKTEHAMAVNQQVRQQLDPLTGFIVPRAYNQAATAMWEQATSLGSDLAVVYVQMRDPSDLTMALGLKMSAKPIPSLRCVYA
jgi:hypothetical protein